jgi:TonB family protein
MSHASLCGLFVTFVFTITFDLRAQPEKPARGTLEYAKSHALYAPRPQYPGQDLVRGWGGTGVFRLAVRPDGTVSGVTVIQSTGHPALDESGKAAFRKWRFYPGQFTTVRIPLTFVHRKR